MILTACIKEYPRNNTEQQALSKHKSALDMTKVQVG